jgi:hypothetical protein
MNIAARLRARRVRSRDRRTVERAIANAATPSVRHELIVMAQQQLNTMR